MRIHTICKEHGTIALVGRGTLISELECVVCVRIADEEYEASRRPCCSRMNVDCTGHGPDEDDAIFYLEITSPNFCDVDHSLVLSEPPF